MLTQKDIDEIEKLIKTTVKEEIKHLPTKDDFYTKMDEVMGELKAIREQQTVISGYKDQIENRETRIEKIEQNLNLQS